MNYVYPKLSDKDLYFFRLGGAGLGNLLFTYARALVFAKKNNYELIWPTWPSIKLGPIIRNEKDKRFYNNLFGNNSNYIDGIRKIKLLKNKPNVSEEDKNGQYDESIVVFEKFIGSFKDIKYDSAMILEDLERNLKNKKALEGFNPQDGICVHIRLGDFSRVSVQEVKSGRHDSALPIEWYVNVINKIRALTGKNLKVYVFSDGKDEELEPVMNLKNTERVTFNNAINDILALSRAKLMIASGSSFSMWARYLGRCNTICYTNQIKEYILTENDISFETETDENVILTSDIEQKIKEMF